MVEKISPFPEPVYFSRPILPDLNELSDRLEEVWRSQWFTNKGAKQKLQKILKVPYLSLFHNDTIAIIIACQILHFSGDVISTPFSFPAIPNVLSWNNIKSFF